MRKPSRRQRDRAAALDAAEHALAIARAQALTRDEVAQQALTRLGPVPATCQRCRVNPPRNFLMYGRGEWLCNACAGVE
jgi:putative heme degradation protein